MQTIQPIPLQDMRAGHDVTGGRGGSVVAERIVGCIANHNRFIPAISANRAEAPARASGLRHYAKAVCRAV